MSGNAEAYNSFACRILSTIRKALQMKLVSRGAGLPCKLPTEAFLSSTRSAGGGVGFKHKCMCCSSCQKRILVVAARRWKKFVFSASWLCAGAYVALSLCCWWCCFMIPLQTWPRSAWHVRRPRNSQAAL